MIVKNNPDYHLTSPKKYQHPHPHIPTNPKPYFLQGLQYAKQLLIQIKKQKLSQIQYSPISRKHTKISHDIIIQQQNIENKIKFTNPKTYDNNKNKMKTQQNDISLQDNFNQIQYTTKVKRSQNTNNNFKKLNIKSYRQQILSYTQPNNPITQQHNISQQTNKIPISTLQSISNYQQQINKIGKQLQQINNQLQAYQIVFDNLCDCYLANQNIYIKNNKLRKQKLRLQQEKQDIINKINQISKEFQQIDILEKQGNQDIGKYVEEYVRDVCLYNREQKMLLEENYQNQIIDQNVVQDNQQEVYQSSLNLNYKKMKNKHDEKVKKKGLLEPKKLQKGVSFQEEIDVISKYYQSELSNI